MDDLISRLALLARAESLAMRIRVRHAARMTMLSAGALAAAVFAFGMLNLGAFTALSARYGQTDAALLLAAGDALLAFVLLMLARRRTPSAEEAMVDELRALALAELSKDAAGLKAQVVHLQHQVTSIGDGIARVTKADPLQLGLSSIGPILALVTRMLGRRKDS